MARCNCSGLVCACKLEAGANIAISGAGTASNPFVISGSGGGSGGDTIPPGVYVPYGGSQAPAGWLLCNGQAVSRTTFAALFAAIGTRYGQGDGATTFQVPNMIDRTFIGAGGSYSAGSSGGADSVQLVVANLPGHTHSIGHNHAAFTTGSGGTHSHKLQTSNDETGTSAATLERAGASGASDSSAAVETTGGHTHTIDVPAFSSSNLSGSTGSSNAFSIVPKYVAGNVIIKT